MFNLDAIKHALGSSIGQSNEPQFDAAQMLEDDHGKVKRNFELFAAAVGEEKRKLVAETLLELTVHTELEEELVYPIIRRADGNLIDEAEQEHHVAEFLIRELQLMLLSAPQFDAKFKVLGEAVKHHIKEEESKALPLLRQQDIDLNELGARLDARKQELIRQYQNQAPEQGSTKEQTARAGQKTKNKRARKLPEPTKAKAADKANATANTIKARPDRAKSRPPETKTGSPRAKATSATQSKATRKSSRSGSVKAASTRKSNPAKRQLPAQARAKVKSRTR